jgi:hypothetical protein
MHSRGCDQNPGRSEPESEKERLGFPSISELREFVSTFRDSDAREALVTDKGEVFLRPELQVPFAVQDGSGFRLTEEAAVYLARVLAGRAEFLSGSLTESRLPDAGGFSTAFSVSQRALAVEALQNILNDEPIDSVHERALRKQIQLEIVRTLACHRIQERKDLWAEGSNTSPNQS